MVDPAERRRARRFEIQLPLIVRWTSGPESSETLTESKNISSRGLFFSAPTNIKQGSPIDILMVLPYEITLADPIRVCCRGLVQRTESQSEGKVEVAVAVEKYEFLRSDEPAA